MSNFLDSAIELTVKAWTPAPKNYVTKRDTLVKILRALNENGIEIPFPQLDVHIKEMPEN